MSLDRPLHGAPDWTPAGPLDPVSVFEVERRRTLIETVKAGLGTFIEVGLALAEIRDSRLYRDTHPTFEAFCADEFGLSRKRAYDLMAGAEVVAGLSPNGDTPLPANEAQARALAAAPPEKRAEVMAQATANGTKKATAKAIEDEVDRSRCSTCKAPAFLLIGGRCTACAEKAADDRCLKCGEITPDATGGSCNACWEASEAPKTKPIRPRPPTAEERAEKEAQQRREDTTEAIARSVTTLHTCFLVPNGAEDAVDGWQPDAAHPWLLLFPDLMTPDGIRGLVRMLDHFANVLEAAR